MRKVMHVLTVIFVLLTFAFFAVYQIYENVVIYSMFVTFLTFSYHFLMRLFVGFAVGAFLKRFIDYSNFWFKSRKFERKIYKKLKVKKWKEHIPAYYPEAFSLEKNTPDEIIITMCNAELTHEVIVIFSFVPVFFSLKFGVPAVFIITSILAASVDMIFVIVQRFNRPRILKLLKK